MKQPNLPSFEIEDIIWIKPKFEITDINGYYDNEIIFDYKLIPINNKLYSGWTNQKYMLSLKELRENTLSKLLNHKQND